MVGKLRGVTHDGHPARKALSRLGSEVESRMLIHPNTEVWVHW